MTNLNSLIDQARERAQAQKDAARVAREAAQAEARAQAITTFKALVLAVLETDLLDALNPTYEARLHFKNVYVTMSWRDDDSSTLWTLEGGSTNDYQTLAMKALTLDSHRTAVLDWSTVRMNELRDQLLQGMAFVRDTVAAARAKAEEHRQRVEQDAVDAEIARRQRAEQDALSCAAADAISAEIGTLIAQRLADEVAHLWQWKLGATITLYSVRYCTGAHLIEEEGAEFDYANGWTLTDELDADGYIHLIGKNPRHLRLDPHTHMPIWERHTFASIDDLPSYFRERSGFVIEGITKAFFSDGKERWIYESGESWGFSAAPEGLPVEWVRALVDQQA